jgi:hypothetical protein
VTPSPAARAAKAARKPRRSMVKYARAVDRMQRHPRSRRPEESNQRSCSLARAARR